MPQTRQEQSTGVSARDGRAQRTARLACGVFLIWIAGWGLVGRIGSRSAPEVGLPVDRERLAHVATRIDPNTAAWTELATLPRIGEVLARRIVAYREEALSRQEASGGTGAVFRRLEDLDPVPGIGPGTLEALADHLVFPGEPESPVR